MPAWRTCLEKVPNHLQGIKVAACFPNECLAQHSSAAYAGHSVTAALDQVILNPHAIPSGRPAVDYGNSAIVRVNVRELLNFGLSVDAVMVKVFLQHFIRCNYATTTVRTSDRTAIDWHKRVCVTLDD